MTSAGAKVCFPWNDTNTRDALRQWQNGVSASDIARSLTKAYGVRVSRCAVIGKLYRHKELSTGVRLVPSTPASPRAAARARGGSRRGGSIFTPESDRLLTDGWHAHRDLPAIIATISAELNVIYSAKQLSDRASVLGLRSKDAPAARIKPVSNWRPPVVFGTPTTYDPGAYGKALSNLAADDTAGCVRIDDLHDGMCRNIRSGEGADALYCAAATPAVRGRRASYCVECQRRLTVLTAPYNERSIRRYVTAGNGRREHGV